MRLEGPEAEWGLAVILASVAGFPLGGHTWTRTSVATDRTMLLPTRSRNADGTMEGRPWLMLKPD
jgi:hypothetical protein